MHESNEVGRETFEESARVLIHLSSMSRSILCLPNETKNSTYLSCLASDVLKRDRRRALAGPCRPGQVVASATEGDSAKGIQEGTDACHHLLSSSGHQYAERLFRQGVSIQPRRGVK